ncbi:unnamed protein product [Sphagnum balticum]
MRREASVGNYTRRRWRVRYDLDETVKFNSVEHIGLQSSNSVASSIPVRSHGWLADSSDHPLESENNRTYSRVGGKSGAGDVGNRGAGGGRVRAFKEQLAKLEGGAEDAVAERLPQPIAPNDNKRGRGESIHSELFLEPFPIYEEEQEFLIVPSTVGR